MPGHQFLQKVKPTRGIPNDELSILSPHTKSKQIKPIRINSAMVS